MNATVFRSTIMMSAVITLKQGTSVLTRLVRKSHTNRWHCRNVSNSTNHSASLYVHWPFCEKRCSYCNFNKYIRKNEDVERFKRCLIVEIRTLLQLSGVGKVTSVFFGGGTPSLASPDVISGILDVLHEQSLLPVGAEVTLEANPTSLEASKLRDFKDHGISRISLGVQALNDHDLQLLGRNHTAMEALRCLEVCHTLFQGKVSVDTIFGRPGQTGESWLKEMDKLLTLVGDHLSLYQLTLERGTALFKRVLNRELFLPSPAVVAQMYIDTVEVMEKHQFRRYEASNFARTMEAESVHNKHYWSGQQYIGVGPGAHGRFTPVGEVQRQARVQTLEPEPWMFEVEKNGHGTRKITRLSQLQVLEEILMLGFRTTEGIPTQRWSTFSPEIALSSIFSDVSIMKTLQAEGLLTLDDSGLRATPNGLNVADGLTAELLPVLQQQWTFLNQTNKLWTSDPSIVTHIK